MYTSWCVNCSVNSIKKWFKTIIPYCTIIIYLFIFLNFQIKTVASHEMTLELKTKGSKQNKNLNSFKMEGLWLNKYNNFKRRNLQFHSLPCFFSSRCITTINCCSHVTREHGKQFWFTGLPCKLQLDFQDHTTIKRLCKNPALMCMDLHGVYSRDPQG